MRVVSIIPMEAGEAEPRLDTKPFEAGTFGPTPEAEALEFIRMMKRVKGPEAAFTIAVLDDGEEVWTEDIYPDSYFTDGATPWT